MSKLQNNIQNINYSSIKRVATEYRELGIKDKEIPRVMGYAIELSNTKAYRLARGILNSTKSLDDFENESKHLIAWAKKAGSKERNIVSKVIRKEKGDEGNIYLIHNISTMSRKDARVFLKDYLNSGGDVKAIYEWLSMAGDVLKKNQNGDAVTTRGLLSWAEKGISALGGALGGAISTIGDALAKAGESLVDAVGSVLEWTAEKIGDFVTSLIEAGKTIGEILEAALEKGATAMRKFVDAILKAGKSIYELIAESLVKLASHIKDVLKALIDIGKSIVEIVGSIVNMGVEIVAKVLQGLLDLRKSMGYILSFIAKSLSNALEKVLEAFIEIGKSITTILSSISSLAKGLIVSIIRALGNLGSTIVDILKSTLSLATDAFKEILLALLALGHTVMELLEIAFDSIKSKITYLIEGLVRLGESIVEFLLWGVELSARVLRDVLKGILAAGKGVVDILSSVASKAFSLIKKTVKELIGLGKKVVDIISDAINVGSKFVKKLLKSLRSIVGALAKFVKEVALFSYRKASALVGSLLSAGVAIAEVMSMVVGESYYVFRRMVNGVIRHTGRVGEMLDWVLTEIEDGVSELWHNTLLAIRYAHGKLTDAIDWAIEKGEVIVERILRTWEEIGENLIDFYRYASTLAINGIENIYRVVGSVTVKIGNSVGYIIDYLERDFIPGMRDFVKGLLDAGYELSMLVVNLTKITAKALIEAVKSLFEYGITLADLIVDTIENPENMLDNMLSAIREAGKTLEDIYQAVIVELSEEYLEEITLRLYHLKYAVKEILDAVVEISAGAVATVISILLRLLGSYRPMREDEVIEARKVYGESLDYNSIYFSQESLSNDIIFGIQEWLSGGDSRPFVTNTLVNFDVNDGEITYPTMIHELCHVWQYGDEGAFYMAEALHAQSFGDGYNYGYTNAINGDGGADDLERAFDEHPNLSDREVFELFNREQQAMIIEHYYVRHYGEEPLDYSAWEPFQHVVAA